MVSDSPNIFTEASKGWNKAITDNSPVGRHDSQRPKENPFRRGGRINDSGYTLPDFKRTSGSCFKSAP
jgi:hypothetical protein